MPFDTQNLVGTLDELIEEDLSDGVQDSLPGLDDVYKKLSTSSFQVRRDGIGRTWQVIHTFREGLSGAFKWAASGGNDARYPITADLVDAHAIYTGDNPVAYPGLDEQAGIQHFQKIISLAKGLGNMFIPTEWIRSAALDASIQDAVAEVIRGTAENVALAEIQCFYATTAQQEIGTIAATPSYENNRATNDRATVIIKTNSVRQLRPGMMIAIAPAAGTSIRVGDSGDELMIDGIRYVPNDSTDTLGYGVIIAQSVASSGTDLSGLSIAAGDIIVRRDSLNTTGAVGYGPIGPEQWLIATGPAVFGIDVDTYTQFQSVVKALGGDVASGTVLDRYFGRLFKAYGMQNMPDTVITSMGVTNAVIENSDGLRRFESMGRKFQFQEGWEYGNVPYGFNGQAMDWLVSAFMPSLSDVTASSAVGGRLWGLKFRDGNMMRYVPPKNPYAGSQEMVGNEVEFTYPLGGPHGIFKPYHSTSGRSTNYQEAPFLCYKAIVPRFMPGLKLTGAQELL